MTGFLLINPRSGDARPSPDELRAAAAERGVETRMLQSGDDPGAIARDAAGDASALGIAGGDGSLAPVATAALESGLPFVCIPFGTRNHFARDLGLDRDDPIGTLAAFDGDQRRIDVGRVNERLFLNNVSLGLYARLVHRREHHRRRREALARGRALWLLLGHRHPVPCTIDGEPTEARIILVANNAYSLQLFSIGEREGIESGKLHLYSAGGWLPGNWDDRSGERFTIDSPSGRLEAALDGEPGELETPLEFSIEPMGLRVLLPPD